MAKQEFSIGDRIIAIVNRQTDRPECVRKAYTGTVEGFYEDADRWYIPYCIKWDDFYSGDDERPPIAPSLDNYDIRKLDEEELSGGFEEALRVELDLIKGVVDSEDLVGRLVTLSSFRDLNRHLSEKLEGEYLELERFVEGGNLTLRSGLAERATVLATLRGLNKYLQGNEEE
jgi:hypothetical protein